MSTLPWVEKYRPKSLVEVRGHSHIKKVLDEFGGISKCPHLLFYGPPGTGKTSTILAMAKQHFGPHMKEMVMEINASDDRGIEIVTGRIKSFVETHSFSGNTVKLVILDEADALTKEAQSALRRILEKSSHGARFCLCCNYVGKIIPPLQSRCTKFRFERIDRDSLRMMALGICEEEKLDLDDRSLDAVLDLSKGDARRVINLLQSCRSSSCYSVDFIYGLTGSPLPSDIERIFNDLLTLSFKDSFEVIMNLVDKMGYAVNEIVQALAMKVLNHVHDQKRLGTVLVEFSNIEYNLAHGGSQKLAVGHLVSAFHCD